jgi:uncharacterized membrane protein (DUF106 family)
MSNLYTYLKKLNVPVVVYSVLAFRALFSNLDYPRVLVLLIASGVYGYNKYLISVENVKVNRVKDELNKLNNEINGIKTALSKSNLSKLNEPKRRF